MRVDETVSPSTSTSGSTLVSNSSRERSISASPRALRPNRKFSPTATSLALSCSIRIRSQNSSASIDEKLSSNGITTSSSTPSPSITSRLMSNGMISFGAASGWITLRGWGSNVSTVSASAITARCADVDAVEGADRDPPRPGLGVGELCDPDAHEPLTLAGSAASARSSAASRGRGLRSSASSTEKGPIAVRRSSSQ